MSAPIVVTGGTGTLGSLVVARLRAAGHEVRILSRSTGADLQTGAGVADALAGAETVVHCAGSAQGDGAKAETLVAAAREAGVRHIVYISVVGADRVPVRTRIDRRMFGYFEQKLAAERVIAASGIPYTTVRATQFYDLVLLVARSLAKLPVVPVPRGMRVQPVAADEVAERLVESALTEPAGLVADVAGPEVLDVRQVVRDLLRRQGRRRPVIRVGLPGAAAKAALGGAILAPDRAVGRQTWAQFLVASGVSSPGGRPRTPER